MHEASDGKVTGVAVLLKAGSERHHSTDLGAYVKDPGQRGGIAGVEVDPASLLPDAAAYYTYMGSLRLPPCSEGVTWFVLKAPMDISPEEIKAFTELYPHDVRPLQPLNGRVVKESR